jgi:DNA modification methylase
MVYPTNVLHMATECANRNHSATFPVALPAWFIKLFTQPDGIVLDPFMGSGTTLLAAVELGRPYVGIDINQEYIQLAKKRTSQKQIPLPNLAETPTIYSPSPQVDVQVSIEP